MNTFQKMPAWLGVVLAMLGLALLSQCSMDFYSGGATMRLDLSTLGRDMVRDILPADDGSHASGIDLVLSDSTGLVIASLDGSSGTATAELEAGGFYGLTVIATISSGGSSPVERVWTWSTTFQVPASGSLGLDVSITRVSLASSTLNLQAGATLPPITAAISGSRAVQPGLVWSSSNPAVLAVGPDGTLSALSAGTAVLSALPDDHGFGDQCTVTIASSSGITISFADPATPTLSGTGAWDSVNGYISASVAQSFAQYIWYVNGVEAAGQTGQNLQMSWDEYWVDGSKVNHDYFLSGQNNLVTVMVRDDKGTVDATDDEWYHMEFYVLVNSSNQGGA